MSIPREVLRKLPKATLLQIRYNPWSNGRWYFARFRLANAIQWQLGPIAVLHRAPWLERPARQLHPHLFVEAAS